MKQVKFRLTDEEYQRYEAIVKNGFNITLPLFFKRVGCSHLNKITGVKESLAESEIDIGTFEYNDVQVFTYLPEEMGYVFNKLIFH